MCPNGFLTCWPFASWSEWRGSNPQPHAPKACALPLALHPDMCPCAGFRRRFNRRAAGSIVSPELDRGYCPRHLHTESNCAPVAPALADMSRSRTCLMAQQGGLEPPAPYGAPAFQAGELPFARTAANGPRRRDEPRRPARYGKRTGKRCTTASRLVLPGRGRGGPGGNSQAPIPSGTKERRNRAA